MDGWTPRIVIHDDPIPPVPAANPAQRKGWRARLDRLPGQLLTLWTGLRAADGRSGAELALAVAVVAAAEASLRRCRFSVHKVIIIIATEPMAQLTTGDPVQKLDDMLPLTSSAILMRLPVGVMF